MSSATNVVLYRYNSSPYSWKVDNLLLLKRIPHVIVNVKSSLPRPEISDLLGITYRQIPILAIGNDVYCDSALIAATIERRFPKSHGYGTIFPYKKHGASADTGLIKAFSRLYSEAIFPLGPILLPWEKYPADFMKDRSALFGQPITAESMLPLREKTISTLASHLTQVEEQLEDGREWVFDTELPSLADMDVYFIFFWIKTYVRVETLFDEKRFPYTLKWLSRLNNYLDSLKKRCQVPQKIDGETAAKSIANGGFESLDVVGFDAKEASRLGLKLGDTVSIAPTGSGKAFPTTGKLVALSLEQFTIEVNGKYGILRCHFPRLNYKAKVVSSSAGSKL